MNKKILLLTVLSASLFSCQKDESLLETESMKTRSGVVMNEVNDLNASRLQLASLLSQALSGDNQMQGLLVKDCLKAFDGDNNVLCAELFESKQRSVSSSFYSLLQNKLNKNMIRNLSFDAKKIDDYMNDLIQKDPLMHVYYYESNQSMDPNNVKFMVLSATGDDEKEPMYIIDAMGNITKHDPSFEPEESMFVIATNERTHLQTDRAGKDDKVYLSTRGLNYVVENVKIAPALEENMMAERANIATTRGAGYSNRDWLHSVRFESYKRLRDVEPASKGQPEVDMYYMFLETNSIMATTDKNGHIISEYREGEGARTFYEPLRGEFCKKKGDKVFRVVFNRQLPMLVDATMLGDKFLYYVLEKDNGKSDVRETPPMSVKTAGIKGKAASDWISAGLDVVKLIGKFLYKEEHDDYICEMYDYVAKDNVINNNSQINDSNYNRATGGLQWWISSKQN
ncbi:MAG: hypothetical protein SOR57_09600 [Parabacteroides sp.]|nr:hypothetical protein [Parabacteroides sp.]